MAVMSSREERARKLGIALARLIGFEYDLDPRWTDNMLGRLEAVAELIMSGDLRLEITDELREAAMEFLSADSSRRREVLGHRERLRNRRKRMK